MTDKSETEPLREWNRLARENTENAIVSSMFLAGARTSESIEKFSTWLLAATAAATVFLINNADKLRSILGEQGFIWCAILLCASCLFGLLSKTYGVLCQQATAINTIIAETFKSHMDAYREQEAQIKEGAKFREIDLQTGIRMDRVIQEFLIPLPKIVRWRVKRQLSKNQGNPQAGNYLVVRRLNRQGAYALLQMLCCLIFLVLGVVAVAIPRHATVAKAAQVKIIVPVALPHR